MKLFKKIVSFFERNFSFEHGVDLNDEVEVLFRRNIVIKNIIFISNIVLPLWGPLHFCFNNQFVYLCKRQLEF